LEEAANEGNPEVDAWVLEAFTSFETHEDHAEEVLEEVHA